MTERSGTQRSKPVAARGGVLAALAGLLVAASPALAHTGQAVAPVGLWRAWVSEPIALAAVGAAAWGYGRGAGELWRRAGVGRGLPRWRFWSFAGGILTLLVALASPLDALGGALFSAHMVQHELLMLVAAPLLVLGTPMVVLLWALPPDWRKGVGGWGRAGPVRVTWRALSHPAIAWSLQAASVWVWHLPVLYQATLDDSLVHALQHATFLGTAILFWWPVLHPSPRRRLVEGIAVIYLFTTAVYGSALGALLTLAARPWYPGYAASAALWGFTPLEDQQLGGLIMWVPFGALYTLIALALLAQWLRRLEAREVATAP